MAKVLEYRPLALIIITNKKRVLWLGVLWLTGLLMVCASVHAQVEIVLEEFIEPETNAIEAFDHLSTGFALTGDHDLLDCKQCHTSGFYEKLPSRCDYCHDNQSASGMPASHAQVTGPCDICHTTTGFIGNFVMDHGFVEGACDMCHNGSSLSGKNPGHVLSSNLCNACHNTVQWLPLQMLDHTQLQAQCVACHDGTKASGKPATHIISTDQCEICHQSTSAWSPAVLQHDQLRETCSNCHRFNNNHGNTSSVCDACHGTENWTIYGKPDHGHIFGSCNTCHSLPMVHPRSTVVCEGCHSTPEWTPVAHVQHGHLLGRCEDCHRVNLPASHVQTSMNCGSCHLDYTSWQSNVLVNHDDIAGPCTQCHVLPNNHPAMLSNCMDCHSMQGFQQVRLDHIKVSSIDCQICHDGMFVTGKPTRHCRTAAPCQSCHNSGDWDSEKRCD
jgi:hypothetical protein